MCIVVCCQLNVFLFYFIGTGGFDRGGPSVAEAAGRDDPHPEM